jgi:hypothetical protein
MRDAGRRLRACDACGMMIDEAGRSRRGIEKGISLCEYRYSQVTVLPVDSLSSMRMQRGGKKGRECVCDDSVGGASPTRSVEEEEICSMSHVCARLQQLHLLALSAICVRCHSEDGGREAQGLMLRSERYAHRSLPRSARRVFSASHWLYAAGETCARLMCDVA